MHRQLVSSSKSDARLAALLDEVREFTQIYVLAKQRHKGCSGTGELMTLREEYKDTIGKLEKYCKEQGYSCAISAADPDAAASALTMATIKK
jgi:hypothetical protein